jgi:hypothetical protein
MYSEIDLTGLVDVHVHTSPDTRPRYADDVQVAREAAQAGMRGVMVKCHWTLTADRAAIAEGVIRAEGYANTRVIGGVALNAALGWLNPYAVEAALAMGAREVWMPTLDLAGPLETRWPGGPVIWNEAGAIHQTVHDILDLVLAADVTLGTGHLPPHEAAALVRLVKERGLRKILVTHPEARFLRMSIETQQEIAGEGVFFEHCYNDVVPVDGSQGVPLQEIAAAIRATGVAANVLSSDYGQAGHPPPVEGLREYLARMMTLDFSWAELQRMAGENPAYLMGV